MGCDPLAERKKVRKRLSILFGLEKQIVGEAAFTEDFAHYPIFDFDNDGFSAYAGLMGSSFRGKDCADRHKCG